MASLKNNIDLISEDTESLVKDYLKLFSIRQAKKLALLLGILFSVFILSLLLLIVIVFCSFALASFLNDLLGHDYWGLLIVASSYILLIVFFILKMLRTQTPLFANQFVKLVAFVFNMEISNDKSIKGLKLESESVKQKIETDKVKIKSNFQMLRYGIMESLLMEFFGLFTSKKKKVKQDTAESNQTTDNKNED